MRRLRTSTSLSIAAVAPRAAEDDRVVRRSPPTRVADDAGARPRGSASSAGRCRDDSVCVFA